MSKEKKSHRQTSMEERSKPYSRPTSDTDTVYERNQAGSDCLEHKGLTAPGDSPSICNKSDQGNQDYSKHAFESREEDPYESNSDKMNPKQKEIFNYVKQWCQKSSQGNNPEPFHLFVSGGTGVGKSHLAKRIYKEASKSLQNGESIHGTTVLLTAPTGMAALGVGGITLHSALNLPVRDTSKYEPLTESCLKTLQDTLSCLKLLIIDEISMVSRNMLKYINERLQQIKIKELSSINQKSVFGNVSILVLGDFYKLAPVNSVSLMIPDNTEGKDLWHYYFKITILEEFVCQKDDAPYAQLLNRLRQTSKSVGLSQEDDAALQYRTKVKCSSSTALHLFTTNKLVNDHNTYMVRKCCSPTLKILSTYIYPVLKNDHNEARDPPWNVYSFDLEESLEIAVGARVMLIRKIELSAGLANGAFGTVVGFEPSDSVTSEITAVYVNFDNNNGKVSVEKYEDTLINGKNKRRQFPLKLAWACTIHKTQGLSIGQCVIDLNEIFKPGQAYTALSRVTSLGGIFLRNYNPDHIYMDEVIHKYIDTMKPHSAATLTHLSSLAASANPSS